MKIFLGEGLNQKVYDGRINLPNFTLAVDVLGNGVLESRYNTIVVQMSDGKVFTLCDCKLQSSYNLSYYPYTFSYYLQGKYDIDNDIIKEYSFEFNEFQSTANNGRISQENDGKKLVINNEQIIKILYENENYKILYKESPYYIRSNRVLECQFKKVISIINKKELKLNDLFLNMRRIENILGFLIRLKMTINRVWISKDEKVFFEMRTNNMSLKQFNVTPYIQELDILEILIKKYYEDEKFSIAIDYFYEYIYNNSDYTVLFIELCNCMDILSDSKTFSSNIKSNINIIRDQIAKHYIDNHLTNESFDNFRKRLNRKRISLFEKLYFYLIVYMKKDSYANEYLNYILSINSTRNYYVHGTKYDNMIPLDQLYATNYLLLHLLDYLLLVNINDNNKCHRYILNAESCINAGAESLGLQ